MPRWTDAEITDLVRTKRATTLPTVEGQTPAERWPELRQFIGPYLHQDFAMDGTAEQCVALAIDGHPAAADRKAVLAELRELQAQGWDEDQVGRALGDLGMDYIPHVNDRSYIEWLDWMEAQLAQATEP